MEYKIIYSSTPEGLVNKVNDLIKQGWEVVGGHCVSEQHRQNRYRGSQHLDTIITVEYTQSMIKKS